MLEESLGYFTSVHREYTLHGLLLTRKKKFAEESQDDCWITAALLMSTLVSVPEGEKLRSPQRGHPGITSAPGTELSECMTGGGSGTVTCNSEAKLSWV